MKNEKLEPGLVSVIVPVYNQRQYIAESLASICRQSYRPVEIIVVDDGSNDRSSEEVTRWYRQLTKEERRGLALRMLRQPNSGLSSARNSGTKISKGEFIQYFDGDDLMADTKLAIHVGYLQEHREVDFVYSPAQQFSGDVRSELLPRIMGVKRSASIKGHLKGAVLNSWNGVFRRRVIESLGPWDPRIKIWIDGEYCLRLLMGNFKIKFIPGVQYYYRVHEMGRISDKFPNQEIVQTFNICEQFVEKSENKRKREQALKCIRDQYCSLILHGIKKGRYGVYRDAATSLSKMPIRFQINPKVIFLRLLVSSVCPRAFRAQIVSLVFSTLSLRRKAVSRFAVWT